MARIIRSKLSKPSKPRSSVRAKRASREISRAEHIKILDALDTKLDALKDKLVKRIKYTADPKRSSRSPRRMSDSRVHEILEEIKDKIDDGLHRIAHGLQREEAGNDLKEYIDLFYQATP